MAVAAVVAATLSAAPVVMPLAALWFWSAFDLLTHEIGTCWDGVDRLPCYHHRKSKFSDVQKEKPPPLDGGRRSPPLRSHPEKGGHAQRRPHRADREARPPSRSTRKRRSTEMETLRVILPSSIVSKLQHLRTYVHTLSWSSSSTAQFRSL